MMPKDAFGSRGNFHGVMKEWCRTKGFLAFCFFGTMPTLTSMLFLLLFKILDGISEPSRNRSRIVFSFEEIFKFSHILNMCNFCFRGSASLCKEESESTIIISSHIESF